MNKLFIISVLQLVLFFQLNAQTKTYNIIDFGAIGDDKTLNSKAIQSTIDKCAQEGGGTVYIPSGVYMTGTIQLKSNMNLYLESGAVLKGSDKVEDYYIGKTRVGLIFTQDVQNVSITGLGTIDGNGDVFFIWDKAKKIDIKGSEYTRQKERFREVKDGIGDGPVVPKDRPYQMIIFSNCKNVSIRDVLISNSPFWTLHLADCDGVVISGIKIWDSLLVPNADGMDLTSCSNVSISDCDIRCGDDCIVLTGYDHHFDLPGYKYIKHISENINVTNCNLVSRSSGIRIGGFDQNSMRNYNFSNINITNSNRGIGLFVRDVGSIENVTFNNIYIETRLHTGDWWGNGEPIHLSAVRLTEKVKLGQIKNIKFSNIICKSESGILVYGTEESIIENVTFRDISYLLVDSKLNESSGGNIDLRPVLDQKLQIFSHDIPAFYAQYVKNLKINDFDLNWKNIKAPFFTHGIEIQNFEDIEINGFKGSPTPNNKKAAAISLKNGRKYLIINSESKSSDETFLLEDKVSKK